MIKIDDDFIVKADGLDYSAWVYADGVNPKTKMPTRNAKLIGYYPNVIKALESIRNYKIHNAISNSVVSLDGTISLIRECDNKFLEQLKEQKND